MPGASMMAAKPGELLSNGIYKIKGVGDVLAERVERVKSVADSSASKDTEHSFMLSLLEFTACLYYGSHRAAGLS